MISLATGLDSGGDYDAADRRDHTRGTLDDVGNADRHGRHHRAVGQGA